MSFIPFIPLATKVVEALMEGILPKKGKFISQRFPSLIRELIERHMNQYSLDYSVE